MVESCPYKNMKGKFNSLFSSNKKEVDQVNNNLEDDKLSVQLSESGMSENKYSKLNVNEDTCPLGYTTEANTQRTQTSNKGCPYNNENKQKPDEKTETKEESSDEEQQGGCPVMNTKKSDPENKHYEESWELPYFGPFDFMFEMRGLLSVEEFNEKTKKLRGYPRHKLYTLFNQNDDKLNKVREKEFPMVFFIYDDIKIKGNKLFKKGKFKEALEYYFYVSLCIINN